MFHSECTFAGCDSHTQFPFEIIVNGVTGNLRGQPLNKLFQKIIVVEDQGFPVQ